MSSIVWNNFCFPCPSFWWFWVDFWYLPIFKHIRFKSPFKLEAEKYVFIRDISNLIISIASWLEKYESPIIKRKQIGEIKHRRRYIKYILNMCKKTFICSYFFDLDFSNLFFTCFFTLVFLFSAFSSFMAFFLAFFSSNVSCFGLEAFTNLLSFSSELSSLNSLPSSLFSSSSFPFSSSFFNISGFCTVPLKSGFNPTRVL